MTRRAAPDEHQVRLSVSVTPKAASWLRYRAKKNGEPVSWLVERAVNHLIKEVRREETIAALKASGEYVGPDE